MFDPVIIVGAPRSGTSMLQKVIREHPDFRSVPRESGFIWMNFVHPSYNDWKGEGICSSQITESMQKNIRAKFDQTAIASASWRLVDQLGIMRNPYSATLARFIYRYFSSVIKTMLAWRATKTSSGPPRLVDKSVHAGLWLPLVDAVFPNACYIHLVRSPERSVPSMINGWRESKRFNTYTLPRAIHIQELGATRQWCFPLPQDWAVLDGSKLAEVCAFQWSAINIAVDDYLTQERFNDRYIRFNLENFAANPYPYIELIANILNLPIDSYFKKICQDLPVVNASISRDKNYESKLAQSWELTKTHYSQINQEILPSPSTQP